MLSQAEKSKQVWRRDRHLGPSASFPISHAEKPKQGAKSTKASVSGKRTTLGDLADAFLARYDRWKAEDV